MNNKIIKYQELSNIDFQWSKSLEICLRIQVKINLKWFSNSEWSRPSFVQPRTYFIMITTANNLVEVPFFRISDQLSQLIL